VSRVPDKDVRLFDDANQPLPVAGIRLELFDAVTFVLLDAKNSVNLNPGAGPASGDWGAVLSFSPTGHPLDIYVSDPNYRYPGNTVRYLNGDTTDRLDIDLVCLPAFANASGFPASTTPLGITRWVQVSPNWTSQEKLAVLNLLFNYLAVIVLRREQFQVLPSGLRELASNWEGALRKLGLNPDDLTL